MTRLFSLIALVLFGCSSPNSQAVNACEIFIKERLRSPSTYKLVSADNLGPSFESEGRTVKMVTVEYDAANAYGTPIRGNQQCVFEVNKDGRFSEDIDFAAKMASIGADSEYARCCILDKSESNVRPEDAATDPLAAAEEAEEAADDAMRAADDAMRAAEEASK